MSRSIVTNQAAPQRADQQRAPSNSRAQPCSRRGGSPFAQLQRSVGNRALNNLLLSRAVQPKLTVGQPDDEYEREADRVADHVMRMAEPQSHTPPLRTLPVVQRACQECEEKVQRQVDPNVERGRCDECIEHGEPVKGGSRVMVQTKSSDSGTEPEATPDSSALSTLNGKGQPLSASTRSFFEQRMGHDFSGVRVHTGTAANQLARSFKARAFTYSKHLVFRSGEYQPETSTGRRLLAHELAHTIQQGVSSSTKQQDSTLSRSPDIQASRDGAAPQIQRVCEVTPPPPTMSCQPAPSSAGTGTNISFGLNAATLSAGAKATLSAIAAAWHTGGEHDIIRIDGFASCEGAAALNWNLSCQRASTVALELEAPSDGSPGIPPSHLEVFANGETDQFSRTSLPPNRLVVVTSGGTPPPGPPCRLTITGPDDVNHYCAAYVPSEARTCGDFPAPNITLSVSGAAAGATLRWSITRNRAKASIVGRNDLTSVTISGDQRSRDRGDVTVQVTDGSCTAVHFITVREPSSMPASVALSNGPTFVQALVTYTVLDQFGNPMGGNICWDETVTSCADTHPGGPRHHGDIGTRPNGTVVDQLRLEVPTGTLPATICRKRNQVITVGGCGPLAQNTYVFQASGVTFNPGTSCTVGATCP